MPFNLRHDGRGVIAARWRSTHPSDHRSGVWQKQNLQRWVSAAVGYRRLVAAHLPRQWTYAAAGVLLGLLLLTGLVVLRNASSQEALTAAWLAGEFSSNALIYGYVGISTALVLGLVGALLGRSQDELELRSVTDSLTGLSNRRHFIQRLDEELARAARYGNSLSLLVLDLDELKQVNDRLGHRAGDVALKLVADCLRESCRATELAVRSGGDEFAVLAPETSADQALDLAVRIQSEFSKKALARFPESHRLSVSIGVADLQRSGAINRDALTDAADRALYAAKAGGRNRAVLAPEPRPGISRPRRRVVRERVL